MPASEYTPNNSEVWRVGELTPGDVLVFPSDIEHYVDNRPEGAHTRISIAFNSFFKGSIGSVEGLSKLYL